MAAGRVALAVLILGMVLGQAAAGNFALCYGACYVQCLIQKKHAKFLGKLLPCAWKCFRECIRAGLDANSADPADFYCNAGCTMDVCQDSIDDGSKMEGCLTHCSTNICKRNV